MSLGGLGEFSSAVSANQTIRNGTDNREWDERCFDYVEEEYGLDVCHQERFQDKRFADISPTDSIRFKISLTDPRNVRQPDQQWTHPDKENVGDFRQLENFKRIKQTRMKQE